MSLKKQIAVALYGQSGLEPLITRAAADLISVSTFDEEGRCFALGTQTLSRKSVLDFAEGSLYGPNGTSAEAATALRNLHVLMVEHSIDIVT